MSKEIEEKDKQEYEEETSIINKINDYFKMPIYYNSEKVELKKNIITDLELINTFDTSCNSIYSFCFNNDNDVSIKLTEQISTYYTTDTQFLKDISYAEPAPSWDDFVDCINSASIFAIITARGHKPSTLKKAVYKYIISKHNGIDSGEVIRNIKKYNKIFQRTGHDASIKGYLDLCKFYPVSFGPMASMASPEQAKVEALREFVNYCEKINKGMPVKIGFSDDDKRNIDLIEKHFSEPRELSKMTIKYTGKQHGE